MPRTAEAGKAGRIQWGDWEAALSPGPPSRRSFRRTHSILRATRISEDVPVMVGWNKTESTVFMLSDKQVFLLDEAQMRKRVEGLVGTGSRCTLLKCIEAKIPNMSPSAVFFNIASYSMMGSGSVTIAERKAAARDARPPIYIALTGKRPIMGGKLISVPTVWKCRCVFDNVENGGEALDRRRSQMLQSWRQK